jgi:hypothetical protein
MITCQLKHLAARCRQRGYTLDEVRPCIVSEDGDTITVDETHSSYPRTPKPGFAPPQPQAAQQPPAPTSGPGTELKSLLKDWLGIESSPTCSCNKMAAKMNAAGPDWCETEAGLAEILGVMRAEHGKRWADGRTRLPWSDFGATQLVRLACRRARAKAAS